MSHGLHVVHDGPRDAPPLLLIHGTGATSGTWNPIIPALAAQRHVIRVDLPGHGRSPAPRSYAVPEQAARVAALLDDLSLHDVPVAGHSSGGYVGASLAEQRPDLVGSLTLISSGPAIDAFLPQPAILRVLLEPPLGPLVYALRTDGMLRKGLSATCARPVHIPDDVVAELRGLTYRTFRAVSRANRAYLDERDLPGRLAALDLRVLVLFGDADPRWDPRSARRYASVPGARIEWLAGVGHLAMFEVPDRTAELLLASAAADR